MRADRLVALLALLQTRTQMTAAEVAAELEVSERTARRDLEALAMAGIPIYSQQGRNGGWRLLGGGRTDLSGLTSAEARALFLVAGPSSSATPEVRAALRKLVRALPEPFREGAEAASNAVVVDPTGWGRAGGAAKPPPPHLDVVQTAVIDGLQVQLGYVARDGSATTRVVHPLGLASKASTWYLIAETDAGLRTFRVDRITSVEPTGDRVVRPDGFDLDAAWRMVTENVELSWATYTARGTADAAMIGVLRGVLGPRLRIGPTVGDGRVEIEVASSHLLALVGEIAGFGASVELVDPAEVRAALRRVAAELTALYDSEAAS
jgi:predicted DNA-binding transcriptional regulator YafY